MTDQEVRALEERSRMLARRATWAANAAVVLAVVSLGLSILRLAGVGS